MENNIKYSFVEIFMAAIIDGPDLSHQASQMKPPGEKYHIISIWKLNNLQMSYFGIYSETFAYYVLKLLF